jgi:transcriptional regulator with XRE-family HTH domain
MSTPTATPEVGSRVKEARRAAGLNEKELAQRLGISLWELERMEAGTKAPWDYLEQLEKETGQSEEWFVPDAPPPPEDEPKAEQPLKFEPTNRRWRDLPWQVKLVGGSLVALMTVRFFTEVVPVVPRIANVIDIVILPIVLVAASAVRGSGRRDELTRWIVPLGTAFLFICIVSMLVNLGRIQIGPAFVFVYGILSPLVFYLALYRLWVPGHARLVTRTIIALGVAQLFVVVFFEIPKFLADPNPDVISGTFGTNGYQLVFFLLISIVTLTGIYTWERQSRVAKWAWLLVPAMFAVMILAQYRAALAIVVVTLLIVALFLGATTGRRGMIAGASAVVAFAVAVGLGAQHIPILKLSETLRLNPLDIALERAKVFDQLDPLYTDNPQFIVTGSGPGTYSSRAWQTFANAGSTSESNTVGKYVLDFTGGQVYDTDVSRKYLPNPHLNHQTVSGSYAVTSPFTSYVAIPAEVGLLGLFAIVAAYGVALLSGAGRVVRLAKNIVPGDPLPALMLAPVVAIFVLMQLAVLENWFEVTRATFLAWGLLAIANKEFNNRGQRPPGPSNGVGVTTTAEKA